MERYSAYKDSGIDWIGEIPAGWDVRRVKTFATASGGGTPSKDNPSFWDGEIPWVSSAEVKQKFIDDTSQHISEDAIANSSTNLYPAGTTVMVVRSGILKHTIPVSFITRDMAVNQDIKAFTFTDYSKRFFRYFVNGMNDRLLLVLTKSTTTVDNIDMDQFMICPFTYPSMQEQELIADYLDERTGAIDAAVEDVERSVELLNEYRQSVISEAVTKGLDPNASMKDSGIDWISQIPVEWKATRLKWLGLLQKGSGIKREDIIAEGKPCIRYGELYTTYGHEVKKVISKIPSELYEIQPKLCDGEILMALTGETKEDIGRATVNQTGNDIAFGGDTLAVKHLTCNGRFLSFAINSEYFNQQRTQGAKGDIIVHLSAQWIANCQIAVPSFTEQQAIADYLEKKLNGIDSLISQKQSLIVRLKEYRASLISECVTGKVRVPCVHETETED
ncbi:hypothetical protein CS006_00500 [Bifidobacterium primatium]|uniref:Type I restriction modification DNA specificity domain-containing protein n=1 Tax=Bifidobacterium primatium TaxID=2045438 RepID=A0A2M9HA74_9BIFI|nr:restriction endonuclease subunit S [Bifidobacterium primatium]PJM73712.1 hypothetical protein CS006_00500 [Bifidobacterium primatium]